MNNVIYVNLKYFNVYLLLERIQELIVPTNASLLFLPMVGRNRKTTFLRILSTTACNSYISKILIRQSVPHVLHMKVGMWKHEDGNSEMQTV